MGFAEKRSEHFSHNQCHMPQQGSTTTVEAVSSPPDLVSVQHVMTHTSSHPGAAGKYALINVVLSLTSKIAEIFQWSL
jgi:hypothetical protein